MVVGELYKYGIEILKDIESPRADAGLLLMHAAGISKAQLILGDREVSEADECKFIDMVNRRAAGEPVQYITGKCDFMSHTFVVDKDVLIPRPETELLVEYILDWCDKDREYKILDIGTGSGCIAISLCARLENSIVYAADISEDALKIAQKNACSIGVDERMSFIKHDITQGVTSIDCEFDIVVSNPPYIPSGDILGLQREVKDFEPLQALDGGADGLDFYRSIIKFARLSQGGLIGVEVGIGQAESVAFMLSECGKYSNIRIEKDLSGIQRMVFAEYL